LLLENNIVMGNNSLAVGFFNDYDTINNNTFVGSFNESTHEVEIPRGTKCVCISYHPLNAPVKVVNFTPIYSVENSLPVESKTVPGHISQYGSIAYAGGTWITKIYRYHGGYITINGENIGTLNVDIAFYSDYDNPSQHNVISLFKRTAYTQEFLVPAGAVCFAITTKSNNDNINKVVSFSPNNEQRFIDAENYHKEYIKGNIIYKPFSFNGKTATFVGDSVTAGFTTGSTTTTENYVKLFCQKVGLTPTNRAIGGAAFTEGYNEVLTLQEQLEQAAVNSDFLFVAGGSNDWQLNVTDTDFRQAVTDICDYIQEHYNGTVIFITPINCIRTNNNPLPLDYYISTLIEIVSGYGYNIVCGSYFPFPSKSGVADAVFGDNIHPSELGYKIYAGSLQSVLC
jgi:lysophospholipase L1-like esterase